METLGIPEIKPLERLKAGEICKLPQGPDQIGILAVCLEVTHNSVVLGFLDKDPSQWRREALSHRIQCASLGADWILEAGHHDTWVMKRQAGFDDAFGVLATESGTLFAFKVGKYQDYFHYRINDMSKDEDLGRMVAVITKFRIWQSEKHRTTPGAVPVYEL